MTITPVKGFARGETIYIVSSWFMSFALPCQASAQMCLEFLTGGRYEPANE